GVLNVDPNPAALLLARCETVSVTECVHALLETVNPAETQSLIHGFGVGQSAFAGILLEEADPNLAHAGMIHLQPATKFGCGFEIFDLQLWLQKLRTRLDDPPRSP